MDASASDEILLAACAQGDREAFAVLVGRHQDRVWRFARCYAPATRAAADDIAQETWLQVYQSAASFRGESSFRTWLYSVTRNVCRQRLRDRAALNEAAWPESEESAEFPDGEPLLWEVLERAERERLVRAAVERLPAAYRLALMLRDWEGLSYGEIAQALDVPVGTVRSRLHNGMARLSVELRALFQEERRGL